jgi:nucleoside-diphosphate-sugar epimerase
MTKGATTLRILMLGGKGNISSSVTHLAARMGHEVTVFSRGPITELEPYGVKHIQGDLRNGEEAKKKLKGRKFDVVADFIAFTKDNVEQDFELFNGNTEHYFFISSITVYQKPLVNYLIREDTPLKSPFDAYARNKIACECYLQERYREDDFPVTIVRPGHTYGETKLALPITHWFESHWTWADRIIKGREIPLFGEGKTLWVATHSDDFAKGLVGLMGNPRTYGHAFHITSDEVITWNYMMEVLGKILGNKPKIVYLPSDYMEKRTGHIGLIHGDKSESTVFDNSKIKSFVPGFKAEIPYHVGIERSVKWFRSHPEACVIDDRYNALLDKMIADYRSGDWLKEQLLQER